MMWMGEEQCSASADGGSCLGEQFLNLPPHGDASVAHMSAFFYCLMTMLSHFRLNLLP